MQPPLGTPCLLGSTGDSRQTGLDDGDAERLRQGAVEEDLSAPQHGRRRLGLGMGT